MVDELGGQQVRDGVLAVGVVVALPLAVDGEQGGADQGGALGAGHRRPDDHVHRAGVVFEGDEHRALGGARALAVGDDAAGARDAPVRKVAQHGGGLHLEGVELRAQQRERVAPERETDAAVVGGHVLRRRGWRERLGKSVGGLLAQPHVAQQRGRPGVDGGDRPRGLMAVPGAGRRCGVRSLRSRSVTCPHGRRWIN